MMPVLMIFFVGWVSGVLVNVLADTLPVNRRIYPPVCPRCAAPQQGAGMLGLGGVYGACSHRRSWRSRMLPLLGGLGALWLWGFSPRLGFAVQWVLLVYFALVFVIDVEHRLILHPVSLGGVLLCGAVGVWRHGISPTLLGGVAGYGIMLGLYALGGAFVRWVSRRRGETLEEVALGFGDVNLAGVLGLLLGWPGIVAGLVLAILAGGVFSAVYLAWMLVRRRYQAFAAIPYGPFLLLAALWLLLQG